MQPEANIESPVTQKDGEVYVPGTCNIGSEELRHRKWAVVYYSLFAALCIILVQALTVSHAWRLLIFFPASAVGICVEQVYMKFCIKFGLMGAYNFGKMGKVHAVKMKEFIRRDRAKTLRMIINGVLVGATVAILYFFLPV